MKIKPEHLFLDGFPTTLYSIYPKHNRMFTDMLRVQLEGDFQDVEIPGNLVDKDIIENIDLFNRLLRDRTERYIFIEDIDKHFNTHTLGPPYIDPLLVETGRRAIVTAQQVPGLWTFYSPVLIAVKILSEDRFSIVSPSSYYANRKLIWEGRIEQDGWYVETETIDRVAESIRKLDRFNKAAFATTIITGIGNTDTVKSTKAKLRNRFQLIESHKARALPNDPNARVSLPSFLPLAFFD